MKSTARLALAAALVCALAAPALATTPNQAPPVHMTPQGYVNPIPMVAAPFVYIPLGCGQLAAFSAATALSTVSGGIPAGATLASISVEANAIRWRDDGVNPSASVGMPLSTSTQGFAYSGNLAALVFIPQTGSATVDVCFYR